MKVRNLIAAAAILALATACQDTDGLTPPTLDSLPVECCPVPTVEPTPDSLPFECCPIPVAD